MSKFNLSSDSVSAISLIKLFLKLFYYPTYEIPQFILRLEVDFHCGEIFTGVSKGLCNNYQEGGVGAEKLGLSSKNLDSTPLQNKKKLVLNPLCCVKNNVLPPTSHHTDSKLD